MVVCKEERHRLINGLASYPLKSGTSDGVHFEAGLSKSLEDYTHQSHSVGVEPPANVSIFKGITVLKSVSTANGKFPHENCLASARCKCIQQRPFHHTYFACNKTLHLKGYK